MLFYSPSTFQGSRAVNFKVKELQPEVWISFLGSGPAFVHFESGSNVTEEGGNFCFSP